MVNINELRRELEELDMSMKWQSLRDLAASFDRGQPVAMPADVRKFIMETMPADITELEKAIVCIALYWYEKDVKEVICNGNS